MQKKPGKKQQPKPNQAGKGRPQQQIRIIGGLWKRTPLPVLDAEGLRPTPDRVRETVFNWLNHLFDGNWSRLAFLDLFAGTGALGFEAASRGAARVVMVEQNTPAVRQLEATKAKLNAAQVSIVRGDALRGAQDMVTRDADVRFDVIFLDPPYHHDLLAKSLPVCAQLLAPGGLVYAESEMPLDVDTPPDWLAAWNVVRADKAGAVYYHLLQCNTPGGFQA
jgi:16S rRNA (guanine(966)-N(2))-methyltransferase RsmD